MKYFNAKRFIDLKRLEADLINKRTPGGVFQPVIRNHRVNTTTCERVVGPCIKGETKVAYGARQPRKGGVIAGGAIWGNRDGV